MTVRIGDVYKTNKCGFCTVVDYTGHNSVTVEFESGYRITTSAKNIICGNVKDRLYPTVMGVGCLGVGKHKAHKTGNNGKSTRTREYALWCSMLSRCYSHRVKKNQPTYLDVVCSEHFKNFQNFAEWCNSQRGFLENGWELDKDIVGDGTIYSEDVCVFVPKEINCLLLDNESIRGDLPVGVSRSRNSFTVKVSKRSTNENSYVGTFLKIEDAIDAYFLEKKKYIKKIANLYIGRIDDRVYNYLVNYCFDKGEGDDL